jgi:hypothetical protein
MERFLGEGTILMRDWIDRLGGPVSRVAGLLAVSLVLASCSEQPTEGRCVFRYSVGDDKGGQMRWGPCNNQDPAMHPLFTPETPAEESKEGDSPDAP